MNLKQNMKQFKVIGEASFLKHKIGDQFSTKDSREIAIAQSMPQLFEEIQMQFHIEYENDVITSVTNNVTAIKYSVGDFVYNNKVHGHITEFNVTGDEIYVYITWSGIGFNICDLTKINFPTYKIGERTTQQRDYKIKSLLITDIVRNNNKFYYILEDKTILTLN